MLFILRQSCWIIKRSSKTADIIVTGSILKDGSWQWNRKGTSFPRLLPMFNVYCGERKQKNPFKSSRDSRNAKHNHFNLEHWHFYLQSQLLHPLHREKKCIYFSAFLITVSASYLHTKWPSRWPRSIIRWPRRCFTDRQLNPNLLATLVPVFNKWQVRGTRKSVWKYLIKR